MIGRFLLQKYGSRQEVVAGCCERCDDPLGPVFRDGNFFISRVTRVAEEGLRAVK